MKKLIIALVCLLAPLGLRAQTTVTGNLKDVGVANATGANTYVRMNLINYGATIPRVLSTNVITNPVKDFHPDLNGNISGTIQGNDTITPAGTTYQVCIFYQGTQFRCATYSIIGTSFNLNTATPISSPPASSSLIYGSKSYVFKQATPATTWVIPHHFGDPEVVAQCADLTNHVIVPDTIVLTDANTTTVTFITAQSGSCVVLTAGNAVFTTSIANALVQNPNGNQNVIGYQLNHNGFSVPDIGTPWTWSAPQTFSTLNAQGGNFTGTYTGPSIISGTTVIGVGKLSVLDGVTMLDATLYPNLQAAIAACSGPACVVDARNPTLGTQTLTSNPFAGLDMPITVMTGPYKVQWDHSFAVDFPSHFRWEMNGTTLFNSGASSGSGVSQLPGILPYKTFMGTRVYSTTGSITSGSPTLSITSATNLSVGSMVAIVGGMGSSASQATTLNGGIGSSDATLTVAATTGWDSARTNWLQIDSELLSCTGTSGATFTGCSRGLLGTSASSHADVSAVQALPALVSEVIGISGTTITLADNASLSVSGAPVYFGVTDVAIEGSGTLDGNQVVGASTLNMLGMSIAYSTRVTVGPGIKIANFDHGGVIVTGSRYNSILASSYTGIGKPGGGLGADIWLFENARNNTVRSSSHTRGNIALIIDDRSDSFTINSRQSSNNIVNLGPIDGPYGYCVDIEGFSSQNTVYLGTCKSSNTGIFISATAQWQGVAPVPSNNTIYFGSIDGGGGVAITASLYTGGNNVVQGGNIIAGSVGAVTGDTIVSSIGGALRATHFGQLSNNGDVAGAVALIAGSKVITFTAPYVGNPVCIAQDQTTIANTVQCVATTTTATLTGTGTDTVKYFIVGNPN